MKIYTALVFLFLGCNSNSSSSFHKDRALDEAKRIYFQMKPDQAYELYEKVWMDSSYSQEDHIEAGLNLARMSWLLYDESSKSLDILEKLSGLETDMDRVNTLWSRVLTSHEKFDEAIAKGNTAISLAESDSRKYEAQVILIRAEIERNKKIIANQSNKPGESIGLRKVFSMCQKIMHEKPGDVLISELYIGLALVLGEMEEVYQGWLSFFRVDTEGHIHKTLRESDRLLRVGIFNSSNKESDYNITAIAMGLSKSGFATYAAMLVDLYSAETEFMELEIRDIVSYNEYLQKIDELTLAFYRASVRNEEDRGAYDSNFEKESEKLFDALSWPSGERQSYNTRNFRREIRKRFNTIYDFQNANGHYGLHLGHIVLDDKRRIEQYGKAAYLRYIAIDQMLSNGYSSWFWDGAAQVGGWTASDYFLQVRTAYNHGPVNAWLMVSDTIQIEKTKIDIIKKTILDDSIATNNPYAYLPGLSLRLEFKARSELRDSLKMAGHSGRNLRIKFISTYEERVRKSSIYAHEGRHAIDDIFSGFMFASEDEFRAKLSEVYFADNPFQAFGAILAPNIGDKTSHGKANLKVIKNIVEWMNNHEDIIEGFDSERPTLPQLDLLSKNQLRMAVRSFDPLAKAN